MNDQTNSPFDADAFMNDQVDEPMATELASVPDGEYTAMIGDFDSSALKTIEYKDKQGNDVSRPVLVLPFIVDDAALKAQMQREQIVHRETFWLDFLPGSSKLDTGPDKNVNLGKLRACLGQNGNGPWSPSMLRNMGPIRIKIATRQDRNNPDKKYTNITKYAPIS